MLLLSNFKIYYSIMLKVISAYNLGQDAVFLLQPGHPKVLASGLCGTTFKRAWSSNKVSEKE